MKSDLRLYDRLSGCIVGTAVADAAGLLREGLSPRRATKMYGTPPLSLNFAFGKGYCSDDTEHTVMVGRALLASRGDVNRFEAYFARDLKKWLMLVPAGIGLGTARAILKLCVGYRTSHSGVASAGNGPAMRAALLGLCAESDEHMRRLVSASTRITHSDPRAVEGALAIAIAARRAATNPEKTPLSIIREIEDIITGEELRSNIAQVISGLEQEQACEDFAGHMGWETGVSGYVNQTVPAALYCWANSSGSFRKTVESAIELGGDTDSVAAIAGAVSASHLGRDAIPKTWIEQLGEWPRDVAWMENLARQLSQLAEQRDVIVPSMHWAATAPRNFLFTTAVLLIGFRRLLPPY